MRGRTSFKCAVAAACPWVAARVGERALNAERRLLGDELGNCTCPFDVLAVRNDLLHESDAQRFGRAELFGGQKEAHSIAPAEFLGPADGRPSEGEDPAPDLQLPKADPFGRDHDVAGQRELDGKGEGDAAHGHDHRFGNLRSPNAERIVSVAAAQGAGAILGDVRAHLRQIEPSREMVAMSENDAGADLGILAELFVRRSERRNRRHIEGIALLGAIDADEKNVVVSLYRDAVAHGEGVWAAPARGVNAVVRCGRAAQAEDRSPLVATATG